MRRALIALFIFAVAAFAANIKLYLKDGGFHVVREYKVEGDRINYYSVERSQWEEIPLELVDLKRTESEVAERQSALSEETKVVAEEEKAIREARAEVAKIPKIQAYITSRTTPLSPSKSPSRRCTTTRAGRF